MGLEVHVAQVGGTAAHHRVVRRQRLVIRQHLARKRASPAAFLHHGHGGAVPWGRGDGVWGAASSPTRPPLRTHSSPSSLKSLPPRSPLLLHSPFNMASLLPAALPFSASLASLSNSDFPTSLPRRAPRPPSPIPSSFLLLFSLSGPLFCRPLLVPHGLLLPPPTPSSPLSFSPASSSLHFPISIAVFPLLTYPVPPHPLSPTPSPLSHPHLADVSPPSPRPVPAPFLFCVSCPSPVFRDKTASEHPCGQETLLKFT